MSDTDLQRDMDAVRRLTAAQRYGEAAQICERLVTAFPDAFDPHFHLAAILLLREPKQAVPYLERAHAIDPAHDEVLTLLARATERVNDWPAAEAWSRKALARDPGNVYAIAAFAAAEIEAGRPEAAIACIEQRFRPGGPDPLADAAVYERLGRAREAIADYPAAFEAHMTGNRIVKTAFADRIDPASQIAGPPALRRIADFYAAMPVQSAPDPVDDLPDPSFLLGFPRSGTTLLENMLAAHPQVETTDERPLLDPIANAAGSTQQSLARLFAASDEEVRKMRSWYWQNARGGPPPAGHVFIDKQPSNTIWLGLIAKVFPRARILFAVRDPRDVLLSNLFLTFDTNPFGLNMLTPEGAAEYYDLVMTAGQAALRAFPHLAVHEVRYESVVEDWEGEVRSVLDFLGPGWDDAVRNYRDTLGERRISTPSARQVSKPVYKTARAKWRRYGFAFDGIRDRLDPWIRHWKHPGWDETAPITDK